MPFPPFTQLFIAGFIVPAVKNFKKRAALVFMRLILQTKEIWFLRGEIDIRRIDICQKVFVNFDIVVYGRTVVI
jgi:hypothetical protein